MVRLKVKKRNILKAIVGLGILYFAVIFVVPLTRNLFKKRKHDVPHIKNVPFRCSKNDRDHEHAPQHLVPNIKFRFYVIAHNDFSVAVARKWSECMPFVEILRIDTSPFFETFAYSTVLKDKEMQKEWSAYDFVGLATYKSLKFLPIEKLKAYLQLAHYGPFDFIPLYSTGENLLPQAIAGHTKDFKVVWDATLAAQGFREEQIRSADQIEVFLRNTFITTPYWMGELVSFMDASVYTAQHNDTLRRLLRSHSHYREAKIDVAHAVFQQDYYYWHPFIFERLPAFFVHIRNVSIFGKYIGYIGYI